MNSYRTLADVPWHHVRQVSGRGGRVCLDGNNHPMYLTGPRAGTTLSLDATGPWTRPWPDPQEDQLTTNGATTDRPPTVPHNVTMVRLTDGTDRVDRTDQASTPSDPLTKLHQLVTHALQLIDGALDQEPTP